MNNNKLLPKVVVLFTTYSVRKGGLCSYCMYVLHKQTIISLIAIWMHKTQFELTRWCSAGLKFWSANVTEPDSTKQQDNIQRIQVQNNVNAWITCT